MKLKFLSLACCTLLWSACGSNKEAEKAEKSTEQTDGDATDEKTEAADTETDQAEPGDMNSLIDDYEKLADDYIVLLEKSLKGDASATTEYISVMNKASELSQNILKSATPLTTEQAARMEAVAKKMSDAAQKAAGAVTTK